MQLPNYKVFLTLILLSTLPLNAQEVKKRVQSVQIEGLGASVMGGISYDTRFKGSAGCGIRAGVAFSTRSTRRVSNNIGYDANGITIPIEMNYLYGFSEKHLGELAIGANPGMYKLKDVAKTAIGDEKPYVLRPSKTVFAYNCFANIGYRYQQERGFGFRCGVSLAFNFGKKHTFDMVPVWPYLGVGYSF